MKVLHFFKTYFPDSYGGVEQVINEIARGASKHGIETSVLSLSKQQDLSPIQFEGHTVYRAKEDLNLASTGISISVFSKFQELAEQADVIHYHYPWPWMDLVHFYYGKKKPTVVTYHSDIVKQKHLLKLYKPLRDRFLGSVDRIVATSPNYLRSSDVLQKFEKKVDVVPIGLDKESYLSPEAERVNSWRKVFGEKFFLFVGVLRYYKGLHILLEAARTAEYPIVIVGAGPVEQELKQQAKKYGLNHIHFVGWVSDEDKVALLSLCYAVVFPSHLRSEAFGISLLEGAMFGKPLISSEIGTGTTYINIDGQTGIVTPPGDAQKVSEAMTWLWTHPEEASVMGKCATERYAKYFTSDKMVKSYIDIYQQVSQ